MLRTETKEVPIGYTCDHCGKEFTYTPKYISLVMSSNHQSYTKDMDDAPVTYESWLEGDYCEECGEKIEKAILEKLPMTERYDMKHNLTDDEPLLVLAGLKDGGNRGMR